MQEHLVNKTEIEYRAMVAHAAVSAMPLTWEQKVHLHHFIDKFAKPLKRVNDVTNGDFAPSHEIIS